MYQCVGVIVLQQIVNHIDFWNLIRFTNFPAFDLTGSNKAISVMTADPKHLLQRMYIDYIWVLPEHMLICCACLYYKNPSFYIQKVVCF